ncbi:hypothetical protein L226DRAFT_608004 [Lentinus tigrinus ALCF2SS1-7]|uniref:Aminoglycoside phosphotransferase domain-containing protein n=1 Tax=Lentinus tigrinus ALCF2SS1-6 TaxID=1328759 RepID=A0A5C2STJ4_9APHY|nr:hypothetical protein L227DRAFT_647889 [Lentinus tigrinus ALCF2SS1-6]RPD80640.1 hypothetical protein L226DRAFT_608004 [Lentinus tigrinus ALCF2SS1-7]
MAADSADKRPLPSVPFGRMVTYALKDHLRTEDGDWCQVWTAEPLDHDDQQDVNPAGHNSPGVVVLKFFIPHNEYEYDSFRPTDPCTQRTKLFEGVHRMAAAHSSMECCQGNTVPYCFGAHEIILPWGEEARVLALEYVPGPMLLDVQLRLEAESEHSQGKLAFEDFESYARLFRQAVEAVKTAHSKGTYHWRIYGEHIIVDEAAQNPVLLCWENPLFLGRMSVDCMILHDFQGLIITFLLCPPHQDAMKRLIKEEYPDLVQWCPAGFDSV